MKQLTPEQLAALQSYAAEHGRNWKSQLCHDWATGQSCGELQLIRNQFGPTWLVRFRFPAENRAVVERRSNDLTSEWCIVFEGKCYPFGSDDYAKELAEWAAPRLESGKETYTPDARFGGAK